MPDLLDRITQDIQRRLEELRPLAREAERLEAALQALGTDTTTTEPTTTPDASSPAAAQAARTPRRRPRTSDGDETVSRAPSQPVRPTRRRAPRGQNRERVMQVVRERPGVTPAEIASASGVQRTVVYTVLRRLEADGEVQRRDLPSGSNGWAVRTNGSSPGSKIASQALAGDAKAAAEPRVGSDSKDKIDPGSAQTENSKPAATTTGGPSSA
jgi:ribosomal protein S25